MIDPLFGWYILAIWIIIVGIIFIFMFKNLK